MSSDRPGFRSYVNWEAGAEQSQPSSLSAPKDDKHPLFEDETMASNVYDTVLLYPSFSDTNVKGSNGIVGQLYCTQFRLRFAPLGFQSGPSVRPTTLQSLLTGHKGMMQQIANFVVQTTRKSTAELIHNFHYSTNMNATTNDHMERSRFLDDRYDVPLHSVEDIWFSTVENKKFRLLTVPFIISFRERVKALRIQCKDFRVLTFDFQLGQPVGPLGNTIFHFAFPSKVDLSVSCVLGRTDTPFPTYDNQYDWQSLLQRTGANARWHITQQNDKFQLTESYPMWVVVPKDLEDNFLVLAGCNWNEHRFPVWCWSSPHGSAIVRCSELTTSDDRNQHIFFAEITKAQYGFDHPAVVVDTNYSISKLAASFVALKKICAIDTCKQFWLADEEWLSAVDHTQWLSAVARALELTHQVVTAIAVNQSSVILQEGEGCDMNCVVSSLAQVCLDAHYRTVRGLQELIQKEWIALAHPFAMRHHAIAAVDGSKTDRQQQQQCPTFLLFLDCLSQIMRRFFWRFEYTDHFLIAIWDLLLSGLSTTFAFNSLRDVHDITDTGRNNNHQENHKVSVVGAWPIDRFYTDEYCSLFLNPFYQIEELSYASVAHDPLFPPHKMCHIELWNECYLRWAPPAQITRGGRVIAVQRVSKDKDSITKLTEERNALLEGRPSVSLRRNNPLVDKQSPNSGFPYCDVAAPRYEEFRTNYSKAVSQRSPRDSDGISMNSVSAVESSQRWKVPGMDSLSVYNDRSAKLASTHSEPNIAEASGGNNNFLGKVNAMFSKGIDAYNSRFYSGGERKSSTDPSAHTKKPSLDSSWQNDFSSPNSSKAKNRAVSKSDDTTGLAIARRVAPPPPLKPPRTYDQSAQMGLRQLSNNSPTSSQIVFTTHL